LDVLTYERHKPHSICLTKLWLWLTYYDNNYVTGSNAIGIC